MTQRSIEPIKVQLLIGVKTFQYIIISEALLEMGKQCDSAGNSILSYDTIIYYILRSE